MSDDRPADPTTLSDAGDPDEGDPRVFAAVQEYLRELEAGRHPSRREFLSRHREIAGELGACLDGLAFVHSAANQIAAEAAPAGPKLPEIDPETAQPLGDYRLIRQIGRGGMGVVYEAVQLSLGRRVALKVLPMAAALDSRHLERFRNEASAAAQLHHTNIVPVYAVGCERSVHYYAMQLIEGQSLDEVIRELRDLGNAREPNALKGVDPKTVVLRGGSASATLSFTAPATDAASPPAFSYSLSTLRTNRNAAYARSVANLGLQIAEALDYAHRVGVVHRDIKPANLLLDAKGTLWITDFGLAQFYADTNLTRSGDLIGTLRYMSPEQASGRAVVLDQRTDVYSLGVTLYELLTLERAFAGTTHEELLTQIARDEPASPRSIDKTIPHELELILAKAYAKDPAERYQSAGAMADDLRRFLRDEPIRARAPSLWDKGVKWMRRHKAVAVSAVVILALAAVGFCISTLLIAREQRQTRKALRLEKQQAIAAENRGRDAREAVQFFANIAAREMDKPEFSEVRREMLEEALGYYQKFLQDPGNNPAVSEELVTARRTYETFLDEYTSLDTFARAMQRISLLASHDVQQELGLTAAKAIDVQGKLRALIDPPGQGPAQDKALSPEARRLKYTDRVKKVEAEMDAQLGEQGARRLKEIQRQHRGLATFSDSDVVDALRLSREQKARIAELQGDARGMWMNHGRDGGGGGGGPGHHRGTTLQDRQAALKPALDLLTAKQRQQWDQLVGRPFEGYAETFMGPGGFGDHGFGGGGPGHGFGHGDDFSGGPRPHDSDGGFGPTDRGDGPLPHD